MHYRRYRPGLGPVIRKPSSRRRGSRRRGSQRRSKNEKSKSSKSRRPSSEKDSHNRDYEEDREVTIFAGRAMPFGQPSALDTNTEILSVNELKRTRPERQLEFSSRRLLSLDLSEEDRPLDKRACHPDCLKKSKVKVNKIIHKLKPNKYSPSKKAKKDRPLKNFLLMPYDDKVHYLFGKGSKIHIFNYSDLFVMS